MEVGLDAHRVHRHALRTHAVEQVVVGLGVGQRLRAQDVDVRRDEYSVGVSLRSPAVGDAEEERLQPYVLEAAALRGGGCSPACWRLQPYVNALCETRRPSSETETLPGASTRVASLRRWMARVAQVSETLGSKTSTRCQGGRTGGLYG